MDEKYARIISCETLLKLSTAGIKQKGLSKPLSVYSLKEENAGCQIYFNKHIALVCKLAFSDHDSSFAASAKIVFISFFFFTSKARAHVVMDDLEIMANPEFLAISSTHLNKTTSDITMSMEMEIKKDVKTVFSSVVLHCKIKGEYREIYRVVDELCSETKKDELIQYSINLIEQFGDLKISSCPIKMVIIEKKLNSLA